MQGTALPTSSQKDCLSTLQRPNFERVESRARLLGMFCRMATRLVQNPAAAFRHTCPCVRVVGKHARAKIENLQLWGLLWGPHIHLGEFRDISNHLATTTEPTEPKRVAGFTAF